MCGTHGAEKNAAAQQTAFTNSMIDQGKTVFGADNSVFNAMSSAYTNILAAGPSQQGFSVAQQNAMNASAITNSANATRFAAGRAANAGAVTPGGVGRFGGGQSTGATGVPAASAGIYQAGAEMEANALNQIQQQNWAQGNENWKVAGEGLAKAPGVFSNMGTFDAAAQTGLDRNATNAKAADARSNWWVAPVEKIAGAGLSFASGGLSGVATGMLGGGGGGQQWGGGMVGNTPDNALSSISYMPGGGPSESAPNIPGSFN